MYDAFTTHYTFGCPRRGQARVRLSAFRTLERLPGAVHPAVHHVVFECGCGDQHPALVADDDLDWAPLGLRQEQFVNLMTGLDDAAPELGDLAAQRLQAGEWPWSFFCYPEDRPRPVFPSSFFLISPGDGALGLAVRCPACDRVSVNLVSLEHVDLPFHNDSEVGVVPYVFAHDAAAMVEEFRAKLDSASFDGRRLSLE